MDEKRERVPGHYGVIRTYDWHKTEFNEQARDASLIFETLCLQEVLLMFPTYVAEGISMGSHQQSAVGQQGEVAYQGSTRRRKVIPSGFRTPVLILEMLTANHSTTEG